MGGDGFAGGAVFEELALDSGKKEILGGVGRERGRA